MWVMTSRSTPAAGRRRRCGPRCGARPPTRRRWRRGRWPRRWRSRYPRRARRPTSPGRCRSCRPMRRRRSSLRLDPHGQGLDGVVGAAEAHRDATDPRDRSVADHLRLEARRDAPGADERLEQGEHPSGRVQRQPLDAEAVEHGVAQTGSSMQWSGCSWVTTRASRSAILQWRCRAEKLPGPQSIQTRVVVVVEEVAGAAGLRRGPGSRRPQHGDAERRRLLHLVAVHDRAP